MITALKNILSRMSFGLKCRFGIFLAVSLTIVFGFFYITNSNPYKYLFDDTLSTKCEQIDIFSGTDEEVKELLRKCSHLKKKIHQV